MNHRNTIQRSLVLEAAAHLDHPTAEEIYDVVCRTHASISRGTVYRNLALLVEQGKLRKVELPSGADHFDITLAGHYHISCRLCGRVADVEIPYQEALLQSIPGTHGYLIEDHDLVLRGLCPQCRERSEEKTQPSIGKPIRHIDTQQQ